MTGQTTHRLLTRASLSDLLESQILSRQLRTGTKLPSERALAERYGVSRPIVREALRGLIERNLVEVRPGRGSYVRDVRAADAALRMDALFRRQEATARDVVEARTMLECTSASLAATRADVTDLAAMAQALTAFDRADGLIDRSRYDLAFHVAIARAARNPVIETMFMAITTLTIELMLRSLADPAVTRISVPYHQVIYAAIERRESDQAHRAMAEHLAVAARTYGDDYERSLERVTQRELGHLLAPNLTLNDLLESTLWAEQPGSAGETGE
jgi:GntR family transcriptional repressor for pyruvate dehydrogenase complex